MHIKTLFVLSVICSFVSGYAGAFEYEDSTPADDYYDNSNTSTEFVEPINDPVFVDDRESDEYAFYHSPRAVSGHPDYARRLPQNIASPGERMIVVNPHSHVWGAYTEQGKLIRAGLATAGARWCSDTGRPCRTKTGLFRIYSLGNSDCVSNLYPVGEGGAPMPYCMYFNGGQGLHGSDHLTEGNISHGCVRVSVNDAEWIRYHFAVRGTKIVIQSY